MAVSYYMPQETAEDGRWKFEDGAAIWWSSPERLHWYFDVDWENDLAFSSHSEAYEQLQEIVVRRGRQNFIASGGKGFEPIPPGECVVKLLDVDGRFNAYNAGSDLYPNVQPGRYARLRVWDKEDEEMYDISRDTYLVLSLLQQRRQILHTFI